MLKQVLAVLAIFGAAQLVATGVDAVKAAAPAAADAAKKEEVVAPAATDADKAAAPVVAEEAKKEEAKK